MSGRYSGALFWPPGSLDMTTSIITVSLALVAAALAAGCAADSQTTSIEPKAPREYRTGSNIPVRERSTSEEEKSRPAAPAEQPRGADPAGKTTN